MTWKYRICLHHAFADYWAATINLPWNTTLFNQYFPGEFKRGMDGKVAALKIEWVGRNGGLDEGEATFKRVVDKDPKTE
jgi:hypothetical protein